MSMIEYSNAAITIKYWDYEDDPVYAEDSDPGNSSGWGLNHNWRAIADAILANYNSVANHVANDGSDHSFIDQDVSQSASPVFAGLNIGEYIYHNGDADTFIRFEDDSIKVTAGGREFIRMTEAAQDQIQFNQSALDVDYQFATVGNNNSIRIIGSDGNVGIKTLSPSYDLTVTGEVSVSTNIYLGEYLYHAGDLDTYMLWSTNELGIYCYGQEKLQLASNRIVVNPLGLTGTDFYVRMNTNTYSIWAEGSNGYVGINNNTPSYQLDVVGDILTSSKVYFIDSTAYITQDESGNLSFTDTSTGTVTLSDLAEGELKVDIPAGAWILPSSDYASLDKDTGTNGDIYRHLFDDSTEEFVEAVVQLPHGDLSGKTVYFEVYGYASTWVTGKNIQLKLYHSAQEDNEDWDALYDNIESGDLALNTTGQDYIDLLSFSETTANLDWESDDQVKIKLSRIAATTDDLSGDWGMTYFRIRFA